MKTNKIELQNTPTDTISKPNIFGVRHVQAILMFCGMMFGYFLRVNISAAIVPMTQPSNVSDIDHYNWDKNTRSLILSSFFWGYVVAQIPSGILAKRFGATIVLTLSTVICCLATVITPFAARIGDWQFIVGLRTLCGLTQGVVYPCMHTLLAKWAPCTERGFIATMVYSGAQLGTAIILFSSGVIFDSSMGWHGIFYISSGIAFTWAVVFYIFGSDSPDTSKYISKQEVEYIKETTGTQSNTQDMTIPWKGILTSVPFYSLMLTHGGYTFGFYTLLTEIPTYLNNVLLLDVKSSALYSATPYLAMFFLSLIFSPLSDMLINQNFLSVTASRKIFNTIGQWTPMICLIALGYVTSENTYMAFVLLTIGVGFNSASSVGYLVNHMDLSPNFAGTLMGISNGFANILSLCAPLVVDAVVKDESNPSEWRIVFYIAAALYFICNLLFLVFGSGKIQKWNDSQPDWSSRNTLTSVSASVAT